MISRISFYLLFFFFFLYGRRLVQAFTATFNASNGDFPLNFDIDQQTPQSAHILKDVLKKISVKERWNLEEIKVSDLIVRNARVGKYQSYEIRLRIGKTDLLFKFSDVVSLWRKFGKRGGFESLINGANSKTVLNPFKLEGPFELIVNNNDDLSLTLPLNTTHTGLQRLLVCEGVTVEVKGAQEVSLFHESDFGLPVNRNVEINEDRSQFWPFWHSLCMPLIPIHIVGSASLVAYRTRNPNAHIETASPSQNTIELLPEKCYSSRYLFKRLACPLDSLTQRLALLEKLMKSFLSDRMPQNGMSGFLKAKIVASTIVHFQLELEREVQENDTFWGTLAEWRTKPAVERAWYKVVALVDEGRLKPLVCEKVRPFIGADSAVWSNLMSNISFTKFPSVLVPPEALTLDVKW